MKERPILFSAPMVQAILAGNKTQTRRSIKPQPTVSENGGICWKNRCYGVNTDGTPYLNVFIKNHCPYGQIGDQLWVRETFCPIYPQDKNYNNGRPIEYDYKASYKHGDRLGDLIGEKKKWTPSIHMPRRASRIQLEITDVRIERLQDISEVDALAEGCRPIEGCKWHTWEEADAGIPMHDHTARDAFSGLWGAINGEDSWTENPWVWVIEFKRVERQE